MRIRINCKSPIWTRSFGIKYNFWISRNPISYCSIWIWIVFLLKSIMNWSCYGRVVRTTYIIFFHNKYLTVIFLICCLKRLYIIKFLIWIWSRIRLKSISISILSFLISTKSNKWKRSFFSLKQLPIISFIYTIKSTY